MLCVTGVYLRKVSNILFSSFALECESLHSLFFFFPAWTTVKKNACPDWLFLDH